MAKVAIIYTGETRTMETAIHYFKKNVLLNDNYHVFAVVQSNNIELDNLCIRKTFGNNLKKINWFNKNDSKWTNLREKQLEKIFIDDNWKNYLRNSGSLIEYYQMHLAYKLCENYEKDNNIEYDFVLRCRTDVIIKDPINFDIIFEKNYIKELLYKIKEFLNSETIISEKVLVMFMNTFYNEKRIFYDYIANSKRTLTNYFNKLLEINDDDEFVNKLLTYLQNGSYIISLRENIVYFVKRKLMNYINILGITYGDYHDDNNLYWFNAESQLENICLVNGIDIFNSTTILEGSSLYGYNHLNYFNENNELKDDKYSFFIKRY